MKIMFFVFVSLILSFSLNAQVNTLNYHVRIKSVKNVPFELFVNNKKTPVKKAGQRMGEGLYLSTEAVTQEETLRLEIRTPEDYRVIWDKDCKVVSDNMCLFSNKSRFSLLPFEAKIKMKDVLPRPLLRKKTPEGYTPQIYDIFHMKAPILFVSCGGRTHIHQPIKTPNTFVSGDDFKQLKAGVPCTASVYDKSSQVTEHKRWEENAGTTSSTSYHFGGNPESFKLVAGLGDTLDLEQFNKGLFIRVLPFWNERDDLQYHYFAQKTQKIPSYNIVSVGDIDVLANGMPLATYTKKVGEGTHFTPFYATQPVILSIDGASSSESFTWIYMTDSDFSSVKQQTSSIFTITPDKSKFISVMRVNAQ